MAMTILFVDEEENARKALQRAFRDMHAEWTIRFAVDPGKGLGDPLRPIDGLDYAFLEEAGLMASVQEWRVLCGGLLAADT